MDQSLSEGLYQDHRLDINHQQPVNMHGMEDFVEQVSADPEFQKPQKLDPMLFISIDPGERNLASAFGSYMLDLHDGTLVIEFDAARLKNESVITTNHLDVEDYYRDLQSWYFRRVNTHERGLLHTFIEAQYFNPHSRFMATKLLVIDSIIYSLFRRSMEGIVTRVPSAECKRSLGLLHDNDKKDKAVKKAKSWFLVDEAAIEAVDSHHKADCINQAIYALTKMTESAFGRPFRPIIKMVNTKKVQAEKAVTLQGALDMANHDQVARDILDKKIRFEDIPDSVRKSERWRAVEIQHEQFEKKVKILQRPKQPPPDSDVGPF